METITPACAAESGLLAELFKALNESRVRYTVMRNYYTLPHSAGGSDLDILIQPADADLARTATLKAIEEAGGVPIGCAETVGFFKIYALGRKPNSNPTEWWGLGLDFNVGLHFSGLRLMEEKAVLPLRYHQGIPVLPDGVAGVLGVLKEVLHNGVFPARYAAAAREAAVDEWPRIESLLDPMGSPALTRLRAMLLSALPPDQLGGDCAQLRGEFLRHVATRVGLVRTFGQRIKYLQSKLWRYARPSGLVLAVLGVDGAGKSTLIHSILPALQDATHNAVTVRHLRPTVLPPLGRLKGRRYSNEGPVTEPHGATPSGTLGSLLRLAYLTLDYIVGYWLWTRPRIAKAPAVVIFDRYAYDMALDPRRFRIALPTPVTNWFAAIAPKPDLIICLLGDSETITARKGELSAAETRRQQTALRAFAEREPRAVLVSTDTDIAQTRDSVLDAICTYLHRRSHGKG